MGAGATGNGYAAGPPACAPGSPYIRDAAASSIPTLELAASFEGLYRRHSRDVYRYALSIVRDPSEAEDVMQTVFLKAYRAYRSGERPQAPRNWLLRITANACRDRWRRELRRPTDVPLEDAPAIVVGDRDQHASFRDALTALAGLPSTQRDVVVLREVDGRSYEEIAGMLGTSVKAVDMALMRARRALRKTRASLGSLGATELPARLAASLSAPLANGTALAVPASLYAKAAASVALAVALTAAAGQVAPGPYGAAVAPLQSASAATYQSTSAATSRMSVRPVETRRLRTIAAKRTHPRSASPREQTATRATVALGVDGTGSALAIAPGGARALDVPTERAVTASASSAADHVGQPDHASRGQLAGDEHAHAEAASSGFSHAASAAGQPAAAVTAAAPGRPQTVDEPAGGIGQAPRASVPPPAPPPPAAPRPAPPPAMPAPPPATSAPPRTVAPSAPIAAPTVPAAPAPALPTAPRVGQPPPAPAAPRQPSVALGGGPVVSQPSVPLADAAALAHTPVTLD